MPPPIPKGAIELDQVHRFSQPWERDASLRLRRGDPDVADVYDLHGRLHGGTGTRMETEAIDAWWQARQNNETVLLSAPTNEAVAHLNNAAQQHRIDAGDLNTRGRSINIGDHRLWIGDEIMTRRNHRQLHTNQGLMIRNRDQWVINTIHRNGDLTVNGSSGRVRLPADYIAAHVELGYAQTGHSTQGRTVDRPILVLDAPTDVRGIYVPMTRGRHHNDAYITATGEQTAVDVFAESLARSWIDQPALARQSELSGANTHRPGTLPDHELRSLLDQNAKISNTLSQLDSDLHWLPRDRDQVRGDLQHAGEQLDRDRDRMRTAEAYLEVHDRPLRRRGHETGIKNARHNVGELPDKIRDRQNEVARFQDRLNGIDHKLTRANELANQRPALETRLADINARLDDDINIRSRQTRRNPPDRIVDTLGTRPPAGKIAQTWDATAGRLDQHQTSYQLTTGIGPNHKPTVPDGFHHSRRVVAAAMRNLNQATNQQQRGTSHTGLGISR